MTRRIGFDVAIVATQRDLPVHSPPYTFPNAPCTVHLVRSTTIQSSDYYHVYHLTRSSVWDGSLHLVLKTMNIASCRKSSVNSLRIIRLERPLTVYPRLRFPTHQAGWYRAGDMQDKGGRIPLVLYLQCLQGHAPFLSSSTFWDDARFECNGWRMNTGPGEVLLSYITMDCILHTYRGCWYPSVVGEASQGAMIFKDWHFGLIW